MREQGEKLTSLASSSHCGIMGIIKVLESDRTVIFILKFYYTAFILTDILVKRSRIIHTYHILLLQNYRIIINSFTQNPILFQEAVIIVTSFFGYYLKTAHHRYKYLHQNMPTQSMLFFAYGLFCAKGSRETANARKLLKSGANFSFHKKFPFVKVCPSCTKRGRTLNTSYQWKRHLLKSS